VLTTIDRENPKALDAALSHPYVRAWAVRSLEQLRPATFSCGDEDQTPTAGGLAAGLGQSRGNLRRRFRGRAALEEIEREHAALSCGGNCVLAR
jgi:HEXXH motif-containing protein